MFANIPGIKVLNKEEIIEESLKSWYIWSWPISVIVFLIAGIIFLGIPKGILIGCAWLLLYPPATIKIPGVKKRVQTGRFRYVVKFDDESLLLDVSSDYDIVKESNDTYVLTEKMNN